MEQPRWQESAAVRMSRIQQRRPQAEEMPSGSTAAKRFENNAEGPRVYQESMAAEDGPSPPRMIPEMVSLSLSTSMYESSDGQHQVKRSTELEVNQTTSTSTKNASKATTAHSPAPDYSSKEIAADVQPVDYSSETEDELELIEILEQKVLSDRTANRFDAEERALSKITVRLAKIASRRPTLLHSYYASVFQLLAVQSKRERWNEAMATIHVLSQEGLQDADKSAFIQHYSAIVQMKMGEWEGAQKMCAKSMRSRSKAFGKEDEWYNKFLGLRIRILWAQGHEEEAEGYFATLPSDFHGEVDDTILAALGDGVRNQTVVQTKEDLHQDEKEKQSIPPPASIGDGVMRSERPGLQSIRLKEEQLRIEEEKLLQIEQQVQEEINQKRKELLAKERRLEELEAELFAQTQGESSPPNVQQQPIAEGVWIQAPRPTNNLNLNSRQVMTSNDANGANGLDAGDNSTVPGLVAYCRKLMFDSIEQGDLPSVSSYIAAGYCRGLNEQGDTPLHVAIKNVTTAGNIDIVDCIVARGVGISASNNEGFQPIHYACIYGSEFPAIIDILCQAGADINSFTFHDTGSITPLISAVLSNDVKVVAHLCAKDWERFPKFRRLMLRMQDEYGSTALHYAAVGNRYEIVDLLIGKAVSLNKSSRPGFFSKKSINGLSQLLAIKNHFGQTPLEQSGVDDRIIRKLLEACH